jgi:hypothetical protein
MGFIRDATGSYTLALLPLVALSGVAAVAILLIGRDTPARVRSAAVTTA